MSSLIFISLAAFFNGIMDTLLWYYPSSVFKNLNAKWWNPNVSYLFVKPFFGWVRIDAWHIAKFLMIACICLSVITYRHIADEFDIVIMLVLWGCSFEGTLRLLKPKQNT